ncbi:hypothetical protein HW115_18630 [Verrucomicrobiaceae bacterium N1E253]|uniref:Uncharacterized protein n=1 Tax=Oceaniferula marina TaxID=2748318 RepID=A0A851GS84_9BACT|nr:hypothetical protein [Oceaniferula marina]NWK57640.1 hypothetical protein [Oceaniferula marina]
MIITILFAVGNLVSGFNIYACLVLLVLGVPPFLPLSVRSGDRLAFITSLVFAGLSIIILVSCMNMFAAAESLSDFEGPNGEGAPIAPIIAVFMFGLFFAIPWIIASLRGYKHIKQQAQQVVAPDR